MAPVTVKVPSSRTLLVALSPGRRMKNLASGRKLSAVIEKARKANSSSEPMIFFVPKKSGVHVY